MRQELRWLLRFWLTAAFFALASLLALLWWRAWLYSGWPSPPSAVAHLVLGEASGEGSYDLVWADMFLWSLVALFTAALLIRRVTRSQASSPTGAT